jgi:hypothetical protein
MDNDDGRKHSDKKRHSQQQRNQNSDRQLFRLGRSMDEISSRDTCIVFVVVAAVSFPLVAVLILIGFEDCLSSE